MKKLKWLTSMLAAVNKFVSSETLRGWAIVVLTACIVGTNIVVCILMDKQISINREQADDFKHFTAAADRPYLSLQGIHYLGDISIGDSVSLTASAINSGRTPAYIVHEFKNITICTSDFFVEKLNPREVISRTVIGSDQTELLVAPGFAITKEIYDKIHTKTSFIYTYIYIEYTDIFGNAYHLSDCSWWDVTYKAFRSAGKYNYAD